MGEEPPSYGCDAIQILEGLEAVRKRPGMYVGSPTDGSGLHHLLWEVVDNAVDEHLAGFGDRIVIHLHHDGSVTVTDEGRGIPTELSEGVSVAERVMTTLFPGGRFGSESDVKQPWFRGVGVCVVNALSRLFDLEIYRDGRVWKQAYERGKPFEPLKVVAETELTGTSLKWWPDPDIFTSVTRFDPKLVAARLRELAALCPGLRFDLHHDGAVRSFCYPLGIESLVDEICADRDAVLPATRFDCAHPLEDGKGSIKAEVALRWLRKGQGGVVSFVNGHRTLGGTHVQGLTSGMALALQDAAPHRAALSDKRLNRTIAALVRRSAAVVKISHPEPRFGSRTRDTLVCQATGWLVCHLVSSQVGALLARNPGALELLLR